MAGLIAALPTARRLMRRAAPEVPLQQQRRHAQRVGDVVEAVARVVRRQQGRDIDVQSQQIADDVGVLRAVEAMEDGGPRQVGSRGPRGVQIGFEPRQERVAHPRVRARATGGRHRAGAELAGDLLPGFRVAADVVQVQRVEGQPDRAELRGERRGRTAAALHDALVVAGHAIAIEQLARRRGMLTGHSTFLLRVTGVLLQVARAVPRVARVLRWTNSGLETRRGRQERQPAGGQNAQADRPGSPHRGRPR